MEQSDAVAAPSLNQFGLREAFTMVLVALAGACKTASETYRAGVRAQTLKECQAQGPDGRVAIVCPACNSHHIATHTLNVQPYDGGKRA